MRQLVYDHRWREGDLILSDNLAVAHEADADTQARRRAGMKSPVSLCPDFCRSLPPPAGEVKKLPLLADSPDRYRLLLPVCGGLAQLDRKEVGLRVLHRVTLEGTAEPSALRKASGWAESGIPTKKEGGRGD